ncbi:polyamine transporter tpo5 [Physcia stellaris]|nr:polyamine transporter tpo5 [Physcia stellaris]
MEHDASSSEEQTRRVIMTILYILTATVGLFLALLHPQLSYQTIRLRNLTSESKKTRTPVESMPKNYDAGPSSGRKRQSRAQEDNDRAVAMKLQEDFDQDLDEDADLLYGTARLKKSEGAKSARDPGKGKGKAYEVNFKHESNSKAAGEACGAPYPKTIAKALRHLHEWTEEVLETTCRKCERPLMKNFDIDRHFARWLATRESSKAFSICSVTCAKSSCAAQTCVGCGKKPGLGKNTADVNGVKIDWCCSAGRDFALWVVLCKYDKQELKVQFQSARNVAASVSGNKMPSKGTGYGAGYGLGHPAFSYDMPDFYAVQTTAPLNFRQAGDKTDDMTGNMLALAIQLLPAEHRTASPAICAMIQLSLLQDKVGSLLRNDSVRNVTSRGRLYFEVFEYTERLGNHPGMSFLACDERYCKKRSAGLQVLSVRTMSDGGSKDDVVERPLVLSDSKEGLDPSLVDCMAKLAAQSSNIISAAHGVGREFNSRSGQDILKIAKRVRDIHKSLAPSSHDYQGRANTGEKAHSWQMYCEHNCVEFVADMLPYMREDLAQDAKDMISSKSDRVRRIATEVAEMSTSLPPNVFVKADEARPDCIKSLIVGPSGTPYEGGLFEFDILCGSRYPEEPPKVLFRTTGRGIAHFNPNLYPNGKVCLSLLGTWYGGSAEETWIPGKSTILSVLISIQAMILCDYPWTNEPGHDREAHSSKSRQLNLKLQACTLHYAVLDWLRDAKKRDGLWQEVVKEYFATNGEAVMATAYRWAKSNPAIRSFVPPNWGDEIASNVCGGRFNSGRDLISDLEGGLKMDGKRKS